MKTGSVKLGSYISIGFVYEKKKAEVIIEKIEKTLDFINIKNEDIKRIIWSQKEITDSAFKSLINRLSNKIGKDLISNSFGMGYGIFD